MTRERRTYDAFGNRQYELYSNTANPCPATSTNYSNVTQVGANNRITSYNGNPVTSDSAGNVTADSLNNYIYDLEGRVCAVKNTVSGTVVQYVYDADGNRVAKGTLAGVTWPTSGSTCSKPTQSGGVEFNVTATYLYRGTAVDTELDGPSGSGGSWHQNAYFGGNLIATYTGQNGVAPALFFEANDALGTKRLEMDTTGRATAYWKSDPFGSYLYQVGSGLDAAENHFTGKERDAESGLDNFGARYFGSSMGRFMSPDPINLTEERLLNPSNTLNKYAYAANNPLKYIDDDGKDITIFYERPTMFPPSAGHILMTAENQQTGDAAVMSFGPIREGLSDTVHTLAGDSVVSTSEFGLAGATADSLRQQYASLTIQTTPEEAQQVIDWINQHGGVEAIAGGYMLYDQNCTTVCRDALKMVNKIAQGNNNWSPQSFWKTAFSQYAGSYWKNNFGWTGSQPGVNYGQPRGGYDSFQLLELLSKQCTDSWDDKTNTLTSSCH